MRVVAGILSILGGLGLIYFGIHQMMGKVPAPFDTPEAAKAGAGLCTIVMLVGVLLTSRSMKKQVDAEADAEAGEPKPNP